MNCRYCLHICKKAGKQRNGKQKWQCKACQRYQLNQYRNKAYLPSINSKITALLKEGCGIRSTARLLNISPTTVIKKIKAIAKTVKRPIIQMGKTYEVDEIRTYIGAKRKLIWVAYALEKESKTIVAISIGGRTKSTLRPMIETLLLSKARWIFTDKLKQYATLIERSIHQTKKWGTNQIERNHLNLRTHLKRLNRRTICYSKSQSMLRACVEIYCWA